MIPTPPRAAVPAQPDARPLVKILAENWKVWPAGQAVEQTSLGDVYCSTRGRSLMFGTHEIAIDQGTAVVTKDMWATQVAALTAAQPAATVIKRGADREFMSERLGHLPDGIYSLYLAPAAQGAAARAVPATAGGDTEADLKEWVEAATAASRTSQVPEDFITHREAWRNALTWLRDHPEDIDDASYWAHELTVFDQAYRDLAKFSASAQTEHVAAGVSENGLESNMTGGAMPERIAATWLTDPTPSPERQFCEWLNSKRGCNVSEVFHEIMQRFASHGQAPAAGAVAGPDKVLKLVDELIKAEASKTRTHEKYMGIAMPDDVYRHFAFLRDECIPELRAKLRDSLAAAPAPAAQADSGVQEDAARWKWLTENCDGDDQDDFINWLCAIVATKASIDAKADEYIRHAALAAKGQKP